MFTIKKTQNALPTITCDVKKHILIFHYIILHWLCNYSTITNHAFLSFHRRVLLWLHPGSRRSTSIGFRQHVPSSFCRHGIHCGDSRCGWPPTSTSITSSFSPSSSTVSVLLFRRVRSQKQQSKYKKKQSVDIYISAVSRLIARSIYL